MKKTAILLISIVLLLATGCSWVKPTPEGEKVRVLDAGEVTRCRELGSTTVSLLNRIAGIERDPEKVERELQILARNSAARAGGDTVVATSPVQNGEQRYAIYRCVGVSE
ncbi:MAG: DUF4156 domain-containing protein [Sedimenticola sp.]|nr:DUF4156 domain-containing protein [Sedimenticola sp.]